MNDEMDEFAKKYREVLSNEYIPYSIPYIYNLALEKAVASLSGLIYISHLVTLNLNQNILKITFTNFLNKR